MPTEISPLPSAQWPYVAILIRLALALALGLLLGLERERRGKEAGLRTFGFIALLGALGGSLGEGFALLAFASTGLLAVLLNVHTLRSGEGTELTTSAAMLITCMAGILCGQGHTITPAAVIVIATALLAWKERLAGLSMGLTEGELRSALLLAILAIVIYPALPVGAIGPWRIVEPRAAWITVILIASIGFVNYILWKLYGARGTELSGFFGGLVNSNFTVIEMATRVHESQGRFAAPAYRGILVATGAMVVRNAALLLILAPLALLDVAGAFALMLAASAALVVTSHLRTSVEDPQGAADIKLTLPFSLRVALKYGALFLVLHMVGTLMQREYGEAGFYVVTVVGGLLSSASAVAAAASMATQGAIAPAVAGNGAVIASLTSIAFSLSFVLRARHRGLTSRLALAMLAVATAGALGLVMSSALRDVLGPWIAKVGMPR
ncbi:MAG: MgtC/SapB family protein [Ideonella sp.]|nr:MgtC/SapB family protein [Ideonella sp.]MCC7457757.1 MgtC/SapB family protein [Nitrospira sp.]